jgi:2,4-dienoyl-CoA reductase-like NADH-dependent reductase (Old Yellow Enzyme family)
MEQSETKNTLLDTIELGDIKLKNRIAMASLTRCKCDPKTGIPNDLLVKHYSDRASAGLILTECSPISFTA